ncbi:adenine phosphoribosyltransferase 3-like isoform X1 [Punica granatum]|uniref:adenine phosphoribosyltransferase n=1 Tax=Punica granatum TaxID=22663 RepID=A0A6P8ELW1_PUNGR|nr:adenine phosphoribosyltransferase 3-like isoform X1 [Punica granatum]
MVLIFMLSFLMEIRKRKKKKSLLLSGNPKLGKWELLSSAPSALSSFSFGIQPKVESFFGAKASCKNNILSLGAFKDTVDMFVERYKDKNISVVAARAGEDRNPTLEFPITESLAGIEARGFIFGPPIALATGAKFVPLRKPKKLPGEVISEEYILEYGRDCLQMHVGAVKAGERALVVDDLIATGGTLCAAMNLLERVGAHVVECACVIELPDLKGRERLNGKPLYVLVESH